MVATLPLLMLGGLGYAVWQRSWEAEAQRELQIATRHASARLLDRLVGAERALATLASQARARLPVSPPGGAGDGAEAPARPTADAAPLFRRVEAVPVVESARDPRAWRGLAAWWHAVPASERSRLRWGPGLSPDKDATAHVVVAWEDADAGLLWLGDVEPRYLFNDLFDDAAGERGCVSDLQGRALHCPAPPREAGVGQEAKLALFLGGHFGADDWQVRLQRDGRPSATDPTPLLRVAGGVLMATVLLVMALGLRQMRRNMRPLERLIDGTRRLAAQDWDARVQLDGHDEFRDLGLAFNDMAMRLGEQSREGAALASIDHHILASRNLEAVLQSVVLRLGELAELAGGGDALVGLVDTQASAPRMRFLQLMQGELHAPPRVIEIGLPPRVWQGLTSGEDGWQPAWQPTAPERAAAEAAGLAGAPLYAAAARWQGRCIGVLLLRVATPSRYDLGQWRRQVGELRNRVVIGWAASTREQELVRQATTDELTGLANRLGFKQALTQALRQAPPFALLCLDLDRFKHINDVLGHAAGDELLVEAARRLRALLPPGGLAARFGGDEFVLLMPAGSTATQAEALGRAVCQALAKGFVLRGQRHELGASVGYVMHPADGRDADTLLRHADMAMYAAKAQGRGRWQRFEAPLESAALERAALERELRAGIEAGELRLHYQPRISVASGRARSVEALVRWQHPRLGLIAPNRFIGVAEESGLIVELGSWVLNEACRQLAAWRGEGLDVAKVSVNVSARQITARDFVDRVQAVLTRHGLAPASLELEVTESVLVDDQLQAGKRLQRLRSLGVAISLDDFGTGYSSMAYLRTMPVDGLKIDRAFVTDLGKDPSAEAVVRAIVTLAQALGIAVVAEGVETETQAAILRALRCDELQGYLYARPLTPAALAAFEGVATASFASPR